MNFKNFSADFGIEFEYFQRDFYYLEGKAALNMVANGNTEFFVLPTAVCSPLKFAFFYTERGTFSSSFMFYINSRILILIFKLF